MSKVIEELVDCPHCRGAGEVASGRCPMCNGDFKVTEAEAVEYDNHFAREVCNAIVEVIGLSITEHHLIRYLNLRNNKGGKNE